MLRFLREGRIRGAAYFLIGFALLLVKQGVDRALAKHFGMQWELWTYLAPLGRLATAPQVTARERQFLFAMAAAALPFLFVGVALTLARLRTLGFPRWLVLLFFAPVLNILFFLLLAGIDDKEAARAGRSWARAIPDSRIGSATAAVLIATVFVVVFTVYSTRFAGIYGTGLFVAAPFSIGLLAVLIYGYRRPRKLGECVFVALLSVLIPGLALVLFAVEGVLCLVMAAGLAAPVAMLGGIVGYAIVNNPLRAPQAAMLLIPLLFSPGMLGWEWYFHQKPERMEVRSAVEIAAPPEAVWREVVAFHEIPPPNDWMFRAGVAYPVRARISGSGRGAVRRCEFSTGAFVEPITVWDEGKLLKFRVTANPPAMNEWSPYRSLETPHIRGYFGSEEGQFRLTRIPNGHTRLEGTTWYRNDIQPAAYWRWWSDYVIHRIHLRVLNHIKIVVEKKG